ncbi:MAG: J domain-containing protein [Candidatus Riflebacteria bacterium]|nr:J domain-containing protein [Candidatus Riflebacteria bacterium]
MKALRSTKSGGSLKFGDRVHGRDENGTFGLFVNLDLRMTGKRPGAYSLLLMLFDKFTGEPVKSFTQNLSDEYGCFYAYSSFTVEKAFFSSTTSFFIPYGTVLSDEQIFYRMIAFVVKSGGSDPEFVASIEIPSSEMLQNELTEESKKAIEAVITVSASVINAGRSVRLDEVTEIKNAVNGVFGKGSATEEYSSSLIDNYLAGRNNLSWAIQYLKNFDITAKITLLGTLLRLSKTAPSASQKRLELVEMTSQELGIESSLFHELRMIYYPSHDADAYKILGLRADSDLIEVKKAYREKCKEFHPDLYQGLPESFQIFAKEQFQRIQDAYQRIVSNRNSEKEFDLAAA